MKNKLIYIAIIGENHKVKDIVNYSSTCQIFYSYRAKGHNISFIMTSFEPVINFCKKYATN